MDNITGLGRTALVGAGAFLASAWVLRRLRDKSYKLPPGPIPLPVVGNLLSFDGNNPMALFDKCREKYGDIFTLYIGSNRVVVLCTEEHVRESFVKRQNETSGRPPYYSFEIMTEFKDIIFGQPDNKIWKLQHKIFHGAIRKFATGANLERLVHEAMDNLVEYYKNVIKDQPFNPMYSMNLLIFNIIAAMTFGKTYEHDDPFFVEFIDVINRVFDDIGSGVMADFVPVLKYLPSKQIRLVKEFMAMFYKYMNDTIDEHRRNFDPKNRRDFTDELIQLQDEVRNSEDGGAMGQMTEKHFSGLLLDLFFAGTDTSRMTLWWLILYMAKYPEVQEHMQQEIDSVVGRDNRVLLSDRPSLPYTEACLHEAMRIRPIVPLSIPHEATVDSAVGEYTFPKGTQIMGYTLAIHQEPSNWPEPEKFDPTRFLDESGAMRPKSELAWMPFSAGKRACLGEALAKAELHITTAALFQKFTFKAVPGRELDTTPKPMALGMIPQDYEIIVEERV